MLFKHPDQPGEIQQVKGSEVAGDTRLDFLTNRDEARQWFLMRNSWGESWGMKGYFTMPYAYLLSPGLSQDFWTIRLVG